jgi:cytoskeletal protein CcmA (bactofilin family)
MNEYPQQPPIQTPQAADSANDLVIGKGVSFTGTVVVPNRAIINGTFNGELTARELIVEPDGVVSGTSTATDVEVKGVLKSTVICNNLLTIQSTGSIEGSIEYGEIVIERGGKFAGTMKQR